MKIKLNKIEFDILAVPAATRAAVLAEPQVQSGLRRSVWKWDKDEGKGENLTPVTKAGGIPIPNGITFFVPKTEANGAVKRNDGPSQRMGERFLEAIGNKKVPDLLRALAQVSPMPQKKLPREAFAALEKEMSFVAVAETDFAVVQLKAADRNLSAYFLLPAIVAFRPAVAEENREAFRGFMEANPDFVPRLPAYVLPPATEAGRNIRRLALSQRVNETKAALDQAADEKAEAALKRAMARLGAEAKVLAPQKKVAANSN